MHKRKKRTREPRKKEGNEEGARGLREDVLTASKEAGKETVLFLDEKNDARQTEHIKGFETDRQAARFIDGSSFLENNGEEHRQTK
mmetsp:Transcript_38293/g.75219  ORF Transcript_38293/g.75219 Transcript_38293/m.75219 type:complete len:86 (+) Transcript_38293:569-826(+)